MRSTNLVILVITGLALFSLFAHAQTFSDTIPPTVSITSPSDGQTVGGTAVSITANACDNVAVAKVEFYLDNTTLIGTSTLAPYGISWNASAGCVPNGPHSLKAVAYDSSNNTNTSSVSIILVNPHVLDIQDSALPEGQSGTQTMLLTVTVTPPSCFPISVNYATADAVPPPPPYGQATTPSDYTATSGTLNIPAQAASGTIGVTIIGDTIIENDEVFYVNLSSPVNATIGDGQGMGIILKDDFPGITISDASLLEGNSGITYMTFTVTVSPVPPFSVSVNYATANGTAICSTSLQSGYDYFCSAGTVTITPNGNGHGYINIPIIGDTTIEPDETFYVNLSSPVNGIIKDGQGVGTILNDDH